MTLTRTELRASKQPEKKKHSFWSTLHWGFLTFLGLIGELLITASFLVGMFAVWQLFWTTLEVEATRDQQVAVFEQSLPAAPKNISTDLRYDAPPKVDKVKTGEVFATMYVPRWQMMQIPVAESTEQWVLDQAFAGHYAGKYDTAMPGEIGNFSVAAHRRSYGNSFRLIHNIKPGDPVVVETKDAFIVYKATNHQIVLPNKTDVIAPVPGNWKAIPEKRFMTMTTCDPEWGNSHRYIQHLEFDHWVPRKSGIPVEITKELN
ncbi:class E sortase [Actinomycetaceae bacterium TAE3-ERU4]|nr:class E sortase [Actinomycetaceae bacterium TAE3-ERU4]